MSVIGLIKGDTKAHIKPLREDRIQQADVAIPRRQRERPCPSSDQKGFQ